MADEVQKTLALELDSPTLNEAGGLSSVSLGRGEVDDDDNGEKRVSWK